MELHSEKLIAESIQQWMNTHDTWQLSEKFIKNGYLKLSGIVTDELKKRVKSDVRGLLEKFAQRRDILIEETGKTPRYLSNVVSQDIFSHSQLLPMIYTHPSLLQLMQELAQEEIFCCPYKPEQLLISKLEHKGDTHGWHWGDFAYTLIWIIEAPAIETGGLLQCVPHTLWNKKHPRINEHLVNNEIKSYYHLPGDIYLLKSDTTLHRVTELQEEATRIILRMGYANQADLEKTIDHSTMQKAFE